MNKIFIILAIFVSISCSKNITYHQELKVSPSGTLSIMFSHNINGETYSCGCSSFPLGGFSQAYGMFKKIELNNSYIYVDTGDALFSSSNLPKIIMDTQVEKAKAIHEAFELIGLNFLLPGDQDFANGEEYLGELSNKSKYKFLISNLQSKLIKHEKWRSFKANDASIFVIAIADPTNFPVQYQNLFLDPKTSISSMIDELKKNGYDQNDSKHRLILLSHSGHGNDVIYAEQFPMIDWIIGAHDQKFTQTPITVGNTNIVQVLSRNHYLGEIKISTEQEKAKDSFAIHEIRDDLEKFVTPNPMNTIMEDHKRRLKEIEDKKYAL